MTQGFIPRHNTFQVANDLPSSVSYAIEGVKHAFKTQRNFRLQVGATGLVLAFAAQMHLDAVRIAVLMITIGSVLVLELLNTAVEAVVDLTIGCKFHPLAKVAKDCAAGAVLTASVCALCIGFLVFQWP